ncbi:ABC transporter permease [Amycolatopsis panacis]|uniref:Autoinducer 2 import system permease protein LsrD n=1 Tax=Amycolatopsis panacis TaxID=2340917 RepID=A0A419I2N5_9PSEU|nr:ABC transporter permease [Amycolatopsis panacis]RJQ84203.1 ABC transporter permease [Amycolatopsis panacis]
MTSSLSSPEGDLTMVGEAAPVVRSHSRSDRLWAGVARYGTLVVLLAIVVTMTILEPSTFATYSNVINILNQSSLAAIIAIGLTFALVSGDFDLSIGYTASLSGVVATTLMASAGLSIPLAFLVAIVVAAAIGLVNGLVVTVVGVNALVGTLGIGTIVVGANFAISGGLPTTLDHPSAFVNLTLGKAAGLPYPIYVMAAIAVLSWIVLNRTALGQSMQAVGGNKTAAEFAGLRVTRVRVIAFVLAAVLAAIAGVMLASRTGSAAANGGDAYLLSSYAAAFYGSSVLRDGQFHILGTIVGVITVIVGFNAIALLGLNTYYQYLFQGLLLIVGVGLGTFARRRST